MFEFKVILDDDDFLQFNYYHMLNGPMGKRNLMYFRLMMLFVSIIAIIIFFLARADIQLILFEAAALAIVSVLWFVYGKKIMLASMRKRMEKLKKDGKLPYYKDSKLRFEEESIHAITPDAETKVKYSLIEKIAVTEHDIYIYYSSIQAFLIPVTVFSGEAEKLKFLEFINGKVDGLREKSR